MMSVTYRRDIGGGAPVRAAPQRDRDELCSANLKIPYRRDLTVIKDQ
jgi:hypothetical protein